MRLDESDERVAELPTLVNDRAGKATLARSPRAVDGRWLGWLELWANGVEEVYLDGAFRRCAEPAHGG
jgi:hypothetical protein